YHDLEARLGALQVFELAAPDEIRARRQPDLLGHRLLRVGDVTAEVAIANVDKDVGRKPRILCADAGCSLGQTNVGYLAERDGPDAPGQPDQHILGDRLWVRAQVARIADRDRITFAALDGRRDRLGAERDGHHVLHVRDHEAVAR